MCSICLCSLGTRREYTHALNLPSSLKIIFVTLESSLHALDLDFARNEDYLGDKQ